MESRQSAIFSSRLSACNPARVRASSATSSESRAERNDWSCAPLKGAAPAYPEKQKQITGRIDAVRNIAAILLTLNSINLLRIFLNAVSIRQWHCPCPGKALNYLRILLHHAGKISRYSCFSSGRTSKHVACLNRSMYFN